MLSTMQIPIKTVKKGSVSHMSYKDVKSSVCDREGLLKINQQATRNPIAESDEEKIRMQAFHFHHWLLRNQFRMYLSNFFRPGPQCKLTSFVFWCWSSFRRLKLWTAVISGPLMSSLYTSATPNMNHNVIDTRWSRGQLTCTQQTHCTIFIFKNEDA